MDDGQTGRRDPLETLLARAGRGYTGERRFHLSAEEVIAFARGVHFALNGNLDDVNHLIAILGRAGISADAARAATRRRAWPLIVGRISR